MPTRTLLRQFVITHHLSDDNIMTLNFCFPPLGIENGIAAPHLCLTDAGRIVEDFEMRHYTDPR